MVRYGVWDGKITEALDGDDQDMTSLSFEGKDQRRNNERRTKQCLVQLRSYHGTGNSTGFPCDWDRA